MMMCLGITHCSECGRPLDDNEYGTCKECREKMKNDNKEE